MSTVRTARSLHANGGGGGGDDDDDGSGTVGSSRRYPAPRSKRAEAMRPVDRATSMDVSREKEENKRQILEVHVHLAAFSVSI